MRKIGKIISAFNGKFNWTQRILMLLGLFVFIGGIILTSTISKKQDNNIEDEKLKIDQNVYMYEEVIFSDEIYLRCVGINATKEDEIYKLNLIVDVNQWNTDMYINKQDIKSEYFSIKQVDINAKSAMSVFLTNVVKATLAASLEAGITGELNVLESIVSFSGDYVTDSIQNASTKKGKVIKASKNQFEPFKTSDSLGKTTTIKLSFDIPKNVYESDYVLVLSVDTKQKFEKNIFLTLRPNMKSYNVSYDANDDEIGVVDVITYEPGIIYEFPKIDLNKEGYKFSYWTSEKDNKQTRVRNLYFYTNQENETFMLYAYYEKEIDREEIIGIGNSIYMKDGAYNIFVSNITAVESHIVKDKKGNETKIIAGNNKQLILIDLTILKEQEKTSHKLDNNDDFYLVNRYIGYDVKDHYGYLKNFNTLKPIDDYSWVGLDINNIGEYNINLLFEIHKNIDVFDELLFLEIDFFWKEKAQTIYLS